jgi:drug/metabolite transporter (DMT)-like permease
MSGRPLRGYAILAITLANLIGGATYLAQKIALEGLPPATVTLLRTLIAMVCIVVWAMFAGGFRFRFARNELWRLALLGTLAFALPTLLGIVGLRGSTAGNGAILILLEPGSILLFSVLLLREHVRAIQVLGIMVGFAGGLVIVLQDAPFEEVFAGQYLQGNLILAAHGILWGLYSPLVKPLMASHRLIDITFVSMGFGLLLLVPAALFEFDAWSSGPHLAEAIWWTVALGLFGSFAAVILWNWSLIHLRASTIAPFVFLQPFAGVLAGHLVLGEVLSEGALLGAALIMLGVAAVLYPGSRRTATA